MEHLINADPQAGGAADQAFSDSENYSVARNSPQVKFSEQLDTQAWTLFLPADNVLAEAGILEIMSVEQLYDHIVLSGALNITELEGLNEITASSGKVPMVETVDGLTSVGGFSVEAIAALPGGSQIYQINGVLR